MEVALYDPGCGYYARAAQRSGRAGDFFTSVDVGPVFGELLEIQIAEMAAILAATTAEPRNDALQMLSRRTLVLSSIWSKPAPGTAGCRPTFSAPRAAAIPLLYDRTRLHLVEASGSARAEHGATMGEEADRLVSSSDSLPSAFEGVLIANELLDALPIHQVVMREGGLREVYVDIAGGAARDA